MNLRKMKRNSSKKRSMRKNFSKNKRENNWQSSIKNLRLSLKRKLNKRKQQRPLPKRITPQCTDKLWLRMMPEMELIAEVLISKLLLTNKQNRIMPLTHSLDLVTCLKFSMLNQKTRKPRRKK